MQWSNREVNRNDNNKIRQEILDSGYDELTDEEHDHQQYLKELIQSGYYALYQITLVDMVEVMRRKGFIINNQINSLIFFALKGLKGYHFLASRYYHSLWKRDSISSHGVKWTDMCGIDSQLVKNSKSGSFFISFCLYYTILRIL